MLWAVFDIKNHFSAFLQCFLQQQANLSYKFLKKLTSEHLELLFILFVKCIYRCFLLDFSNFSNLFETSGSWYWWKGRQYRNQGQSKKCWKIWKWGKSYLRVRGNHKEHKKISSGWRTSKAKIFNRFKFLLLNLLRSTRK